MEKILKKIRDREDYLVKIEKDEEIMTACYYSMGTISIFTLFKSEKEYLKQSCIKEIRRLRLSIECLTDED